MAKFSSTPGMSWNVAPMDKWVAVFGMHALYALAFIRMKAGTSGWTQPASLDHRRVILIRIMLTGHQHFP